MSTAQFSLAGRLDGSNAPATEKDLLALLETHSAVDVNLAGLDYVSSAGLRVFLATAKAAKGKGGKVVLVSPKPAVLEVLQISGFDRILEIRS
ncbi:MAG: STAS domain-containing protein [Burkholderiales bacterium]|jgi:anti-anti-sigma factor